MKYTPSVRGTLKTTVNLLFIGLLWSGLSAASTEITPMTRGSAQQLEGVRGRNWSEWLWGVGGQATYLADDSEDDSIYELTNDSGLEWKVKTKNQDWLHLNRGDGSNNLVRTPIVRF